MESSPFIQSKLVNYTTASTATKEVKNNRYHYLLEFDDAVGWTWLYAQVQTLSEQLEVDLELWKLRPGPYCFVVEVREIDRRPNIDEEQVGLGQFENE